ncbi:hypothetical protein CR513_02820, partial [Mucuna pruriens]
MFDELAVNCAKLSLILAIVSMLQESKRLVEKLKLPTLAYPKSYKLQWLNSVGEVVVPLAFTVGQYKDEVLCDVPLSPKEVNEDQTRMKLRREKRQKERKERKKRVKKERWMNHPKGPLRPKDYKHPKQKRKKKMQKERRDCM